MFYFTGQKRVTKDIMKLLTPLGVALWYFDDGHFDKRYLQYRICTASFPLEDQKLMRDMLRRRFEIETSILRYFDKVHKKRRFHLYITKKSQKNFEELIRPFVIPCLEYKFGHVQTVPQRLDVSSFVQNFLHETMIQSVLTGNSKSVAEMSTPSSNRE